MLVNAYLKHKRVIICGHEADRPESENVNMPGYPFEENGYTVRSISGDYEGVFLSYKIERPVFPGFETDTEFALNAVSPEPLKPSELELRIDQAKLEYLATVKEGSLKRIGLLNSDAATLKSLIHSKLSSNYIYNMSYEPTHQTTKFNVILEVSDPAREERFRVLVALEYLADQKALRLITLH